MLFFCVNKYAIIRTVITMKKGKYAGLYLLVFFLSLAITSTRWAINKFAFLSFDETLFQLTSPMKSAESSIITSYLSKGLLLGFIISIIVFIIIIFSYKYLLNKIKPIYLKILLAVVSIVIVYTCLYKIDFVNYVKNYCRESNFIEENYVNPKDVEIEFPEQKRNLIYIYAESLESTYFSKELGGETDYNLLEPLTDLTKNNINFSDTNKFGGALTVPGTTWTTGAMVAQSAGIPLKFKGLHTKKSALVSNAVTLGDILHDNGYNQMFMIGSDSGFGYRGEYFKKHGNNEIYDYNTAIKKKKIEEDYYVWWGYEDSKLFEYAKEEIVDLSQKDKPFSFTMLTTNTHFTDGYIEKDCHKKYKNTYYNAVSCSATQIEEFISWAQEQPFYENTTIVLVGDHVSMQNDAYPKEANRRIYNLFINTGMDTANTTNRELSTIDYFTTTLASIGVNNKGDRLGLGTNLFSDKKTLIEKKGYKKVKKEIAKHSNYYFKTFIN